MNDNLAHGAVVDASVAVKWAVEEEDSDKAEQLSAVPLYAPSLLLAEVANVLWRKTRTGDLTITEAGERLEWITAVPIVFTEEAVLAHPALVLSHTLDHPVYDCFYGALSNIRRLPLVSDDKKFFKKVISSGCLIVKPILLETLNLSPQS